MFKNSLIQEVSNIPWSSTFNLENDNIFYCGYNNGSIASYDLRKSTIELGHTDTSINNIRPVPVSSIQYSKRDSLR